MAGPFLSATLSIQATTDPTASGSDIDGVLPKDRLVLGRASGPGNVAVLFGSSTGRDGIGGVSVLALARERIKRVVFVMQENRSFDSYFGTYPGADGIPTRDGVPSVCVPDPASGGCVAPFHDPNDVSFGGPHHAAAAKADVDHGRMDGFIREAQAASVPTARLEEGHARQS